MAKSVDPDQIPYTVCSGLPIPMFRIIQVHVYQETYFPAHYTYPSRLTLQTKCKDLYKTVQNYQAGWSSHITEGWYHISFTGTNIVLDSNQINSFLHMLCVLIGISEAIPISTHNMFSGRNKKLSSVLVKNKSIVPGAYVPSSCLIVYKHLPAKFFRLCVLV